MLLITIELYRNGDRICWWKLCRGVFYVFWEILRRFSWRGRGLLLKKIGIGWGLFLFDFFRIFCIRGLRNLMNIRLFDHIFRIKDLCVLLCIDHFLNMHQDCFYSNKIVNCLRFLSNTIYIIIINKISWGGAI